MHRHYSAGNGHFLDGRFERHGLDFDHDRPSVTCRKAVVTSPGNNSPSAGRGLGDPRLGPGVAAAAVSTNAALAKYDLIDMCLLPPLVIRADERRRVKAGPTKLAATQTVAWPWVRAGVASPLNYATDRRQR